GDFVRALIRSGAVSACHDISDGGLAVALAEMAIAGGIGATIELPHGLDPLPFLFGEDQGRYVVVVPHAPDSAAVRAIVEKAARLGIRTPVIGVTGGADLKLGDRHAIPVSMLRQVHEQWFPDYMGH